MPTVKPSTFVKEHAPWSISKAGVALNCPHRFYLQYIKKVRLDLPPNPDSLVGTTVHKALELALTDRPLNRCLELAIAENKLTTNEIDRVMGFEVSAQNFIRKFNAYRKKHNGGEPQLEKRFAIDFDGNPTKFFDNKGFLRGVIDLYMLIQDKPHAVILDHKTGKEHDLNFYDPQFNSYLLLLKAQRPQLQGIVVGINFLLTDNVEFKNRGKLCDVRDVTPIFEEMITYLNNATMDTHKHTVCNKGPLCGWCDYISVCPAHSDGKNGRHE
jgi:hypothetical protein